METVCWDLINPDGSEHHSQAHLTGGQRRLAYEVTFCGTVIPGENWPGISAHVVMRGGTPPADRYPPCRRCAEV